MSVSRHPVALRLERTVGEGTKLLATVMALPLVDGIFPALVLAGALGGPVGILEVGLLVFGGSATLAVVLAEMDGSRRERATSILAVAALVVPLAAVEAALAPTIQHLVDMTVFRRFAALVILAVAAKTASSTIGEYLPRPATIVGLGLIASFDPTNVRLTLVADPSLVVHGVAAAAVGVGFALSVAVLAPWLHGGVDLDRFRFGSAVALGVLALSILEVGVVPSNAPVALAVLAVTSLLAFDPGAGDGVPEEASTTATDGGTGPEQAVDSVDDGSGADDSDEDDASGTPGISDGDRAPWL